MTGAIESAILLIVAVICAAILAMAVSTGYFYDGRDILIRISYRRSEYPHGF